MGRFVVGDQVFLGQGNHVELEGYLEHYCSVDGCWKGRLGEDLLCYDHSAAGLVLPEPSPHVAERRAKVEARDAAGAEAALEATTYTNASTGPVAITTPDGYRVTYVKPIDDPFMEVYDEKEEPVPEPAPNTNDTEHWDLIAPYEHMIRGAGRMKEEVRDEETALSNKWLRDVVSARLVPAPRKAPDPLPWAVVVLSAAVALACSGFVVLAYVVLHWCLGL